MYKMFRKLYKKYWQPKAAEKKENIVEATMSVRFIFRLSGLSIFMHKIKHGRVISEFTILGFVCFLVSSTLFYYGIYVAFAEDQNIIRSLYDTKLKHYGETYEKIVSVIYGSYAAWKMAYDLSKTTALMQAVVDIDKEINMMGVKIDYRYQLQITAVVVLIDSVVLWLRHLTTYGILYYIGETNIPSERIFQVIATDALAILVTAYYCNFLKVLTQRYNIVNTILSNLIDPAALDAKMLFRQNTKNASTVLRIQNDIACNRMQNCSKVYSMLYKTSFIVNDKFGLILSLTVFIPVTFMILDSFYFMEATATGLFHDFANYLSLLIYLIWSIVCDAGIIYFTIYFSESTVDETKKACLIINDILNSSASPLIKQEALHISVQFIHQTPQFTAFRLYKLDYPLILDIFRTMTTFLALLLQYAAE